MPNSQSNRRTFHCATIEHVREASQKQVNCYWWWCPSHIPSCSAAIEAYHACRRHERLTYPQRAPANRLLICCCCTISSTSVWLWEWRCWLKKNFFFSAFFPDWISHPPPAIEQQNTIQKRDTRSCHSILDKSDNRSTWSNPKCHCHLQQQRHRIPQR